MPRWPVAALCVFVSSLLAGPVCAEESAGPKRRALLVGVSTYRKAGLADKPLPFAAPDMDLLHAELKAAGWDVIRLVSRGAENTATRADVLRELGNLLEGVEAEDLVLVALSGHGQQFRAKVRGENEPVEEAFFCPSDAVPSEPATLIGMTELLQILGGKGGKNLVLLDACRDDPRRGGKGVDGNTARNVPVNTSVLFSCAARQQSFETNQMYGKDSGKGHGVFFRRVLLGLRGDAMNDRGEVTWDRLTEYVKESVNDDAVKWFPERAVLNAANQKVVQTPHSVGSLVGKSPVLLKLPGGGASKSAAVGLCPAPASADGRFKDVVLDKALAPVLADNPSWMDMPGVRRVQVADGRWLLLCVTQARLEADSAANRVDAEKVCRNKMAAHLLQWSKDTRTATRTETEGERAREFIRTEAQGHVRLLTPLGHWTAAGGDVYYAAYGKLFEPSEVVPR